jgi:hypothetical protein
MRCLAAISGAVNEYDPNIIIGTGWFFMMIYCYQFELLVVCEVGNFWRK